MLFDLVLAHHGTLRWALLIIPIALVIAWVRWAEHRSRANAGEDEPDVAGSNIADDDERTG